MCNLQLCLYISVISVGKVVAHTRNYLIIKQWMFFINEYVFLYLGSQAVENQSIFFFLFVKHQFKDGGFKSFCVIVLLIEIRDEFLLVKRESMADYKVAVYPVEFAVLGNHNLYFSCHIRLVYGFLSLSRREVSSSSTSSILGRADFKFSGIALLSW